MLGKVKCFLSLILTIEANNSRVHARIVTEFGRLRLNLVIIPDPQYIAAMPPDESPTAPDDLLEQHGDYLFRFAIVRLQDQSLAEELVQETLVKAIKNYASFRGEASLRTWLVQILRNEIASYFRSLKRERKVFSSSEPESSADLAGLLDPKIGNEEFRTEVEKQEFWTTVRECFAKMPDHLLETFLSKLHNTDQKTEVVCKELGITASNFSVRMFRARVLLRKCLETAWFEAEP